MTALGSMQVRWALAFLSALLYAGLCVGIWWRERRRVQRAQAEALALSTAREGAEPILVAYASQTGQAEDIARETARLLHTAGEPVQLCPLGEVTVSTLESTRTALFVVSTYGEGDAPDNAAAFFQDCMDQPRDLKTLSYGLLALGDRTYDHFCGFGRGLDEWLRASGAQALFDRVDMDSGAPQALQAWQQHLSQVASVGALPAWQSPALESWTLAVREHLNPGSTGGGVFHLELAPLADAQATWEAGDLVELPVPPDAAPPRNYSVASVPADGRLHLMVRESFRADGTPGLASGWLCRDLPLGGTVDLRVRAHANFRAEWNAQRPLILIANGTGLAGLRSHLRHRAACRQRGDHARGGDWLVYGERQAAHDRPYRSELEAWLVEGVLERLDLAFSRDQERRVYVQDKLLEQAELLRHWVRDRDAAIYVSGSLQGMAQGVDEALRQILGTGEVDLLLQAGRYRRDVY